MYRRLKKILVSALILAVLAATMISVTAFAGERSVSVNIPVNVSVSGSSIPDGTEYKLVIETTENAPLPENSTIIVKDGGDASFGPIVYTQPDDYHYTIYQSSEAKDNFTYDDTVYNVTVQIVNNDEGGLSANVVAGIQGFAEKTAAIQFANTYTAPNTGGNTGGGGGSSSGGGGGGRTDLTTDDTITITDSGTPTAQIGDGDVPLSPGDVIDQIVDTIVPLAVLPKTGDGSISYAALLAVLLVSGGLAGGMYWKRKKTENTAE